MSIVQNKDTNPCWKLSPQSANYVEDAQAGSTKRRGNKPIW